MVAGKSFMKFQPKRHFKTIFKFNNGRNSNQNYCKKQSFLFWFLENGKIVKKSLEDFKKRKFKINKKLFKK